MENPPCTIQIYMLMMHKWLHPELNTITWESNTNDGRMSWLSSFRFLIVWSPKRGMKQTCFQSFESLSQIRLYLTISSSNTIYKTWSWLPSIATLCSELTVLPLTSIWRLTTSLFLTSSQSIVQSPHISSFILAVIKFDNAYSNPQYFTKSGSWLKCVNKIRLTE